MPPLPVPARPSAPPAYARRSRIDRSAMPLHVVSFLEVYCFASFDFCFGQITHTAGIQIVARENEASAALARSTCLVDPGSGNNPSLDLPMLTIQIVIGCAFA